MTATVHKAGAADEYYFVEGCHILEVVNTEARPDMSIVRARVAPGVSTRWHRLKDTTERYVICEGTGRVEVGELEPQRVEPHDVVEIPPMCPQRITNIGDTDLVFMAICTPRFTPDIYEDIEPSA